jgi:hypothetical protein
MRSEVQPEESASDRKAPPRIVATHIVLSKLGRKRQLRPIRLLDDHFRRLYRFVIRILAMREPTERAKNEQHQCGR